METNLLDRMLSAYQEAQAPVTVTLQNNIRISGRIRAFDSYVIMMEGQKREILYRHAMSSVCPGAQEETKRTEASARPSSAKPGSRPEKTPPKSGAKTPHREPAISASPSESSINNTMKEGLLKWMQEQKAAK